MTITDKAIYRIHTSDRTLFRRCRRRWDLQSPLRQMLVSNAEPSSALWLGTLFHFALEDWHGYRRWQHPFDALNAACEAHPMRDRPYDWEELLELGHGMLSYYVDQWLPRHHGFYSTLVVDGAPQVETYFEIPIIETNDHTVLYCGTFDRVVIDRAGFVWVVDYKTTAQIDDSRTDIEPQTDSYTVAGRLIYGDAFAGVIIQQHRKRVPAYPTELKKGGFSVAKDQVTTHAVYRQALIDRYGEVPAEYVAILNHLASSESVFGDAFIRRDTIPRNVHQFNAEVDHMLAEIGEMLNPLLPIYPSRSQYCNRDCNMRDLCIKMDDGSDFDHEIAERWRRESRKERDDRWQTNLQYPALTRARAELFKGDQPPASMPPVTAPLDNRALWTAIPDHL